MNGGAETAASNHPNIRLFDVPGHTTSPFPKSNCPGNWKVCSPKTSGRFSGVGYFFGRRLHKELNVPIGLIGTNWGGTRIEPWTPPVGFRQVPQLKSLADQASKYDTTTEIGRKNWGTYLDGVAAWLPDAKAAIAAGRTPAAPPKTPSASSSGPAGIYNAMVHPLAPYALRGAIWYQGESNGNEGESYYHKMQALIGGWRKVWGQDIGFYFVQLANFRQPNKAPGGGDGWAKLREAQRKALTIPHTGMAVATDIGNARDIHPPQQTRRRPPPRPMGPAPNLQTQGSRSQRASLQESRGQRQLRLRLVRSRRQGPNRRRQKRPHPRPRNPRHQTPPLVHRRRR